MDKQQIIQNNKLITLFMSNGTTDVNHNQYHTNWNELMPVVEKIEKLVFKDDLFYNVNILGGNSVLIISSTGDELIASESKETKLKCVYEAVVEFIKWYNE